MNKLTTIYLVRHGRTEWNEKKLIQGHSDSPLTPEGVKQAKNLAKKFKNVKFDYVFSSDLERAMRTAKIATLEHKLAIKTTKLLRERTYGPLEGMNSTNFKEWDEMLEGLNEEDRYTFKYKDQIESDEEIVTRFMTFIREFAILDPGKTILVVSHGGLMRAVLRKLGLGTYKELSHGAVSNSANVRIETDGVDFFIKEHEGIKFTS